MLGVSIFTCTWLVLPLLGETGSCTRSMLTQMASDDDKMILHITCQNAKFIIYKGFLLLNIYFDNGSYQVYPVINTSLDHNKKINFWICFSGRVPSPWIIQGRCGMYVLQVHSVGKSKQVLSVCCWKIQVWKVIMQG